MNYYGKLNLPIYTNNGVTQLQQDSDTAPQTLEAIYLIDDDNIARSLQPEHDVWNKYAESSLLYIGENGNWNKNMLDQTALAQGIYSLKAPIYAHNPGFGTSYQTLEVATWDPSVDSMSIEWVNAAAPYFGNLRRFINTITVPICCADADGVLRRIHRIERYCFANCYELTEIFIPKTITTIDNTAFYIETPIGTGDFEPAYSRTIYYEGTTNDWDNITFTNTVYNSSTGKYETTEVGSFAPELPDNITITINYESMNPSWDFERRFLESGNGYAKIY